MPYIDSGRAAALHARPYEAGTPEELAFVLCDIVDSYIGPDVRARRIIEVKGALDETRSELDRRVSDPHEAEAQRKRGVQDPFLFSRRD